MKSKAFRGYRGNKRGLVISCNARSESFVPNSSNSPILKALLKVYCVDEPFLGLGEIAASAPPDSASLHHLRMADAGPDCLRNLVASRFTILRICIAGRSSAMASRITLNKNGMKRLTQTVWRAHRRGLPAVDCRLAIGIGWSALRGIRSVIGESLPSNAVVCIP